MEYKGLCLCPITAEASFADAYRLLEQSFPKDERRSRQGQYELLRKENYHLLACRDEADRLLGLCAVWELADWLFLEHLAVDAAYRNGGIGAQILALLAKGTQKRLCLEVEPPETPLASRRIGFYRRNGFTLNAFPYEQPPLGEDRQAIPLLLMTTGGELTPSAFCALRDLLYRQVYGKSVKEESGF